jgi:hypothetical protein
MIRVSLHATENAKPQYIKVLPPEDHPGLSFQAVDLRFAPFHCSTLKKTPLRPLHNPGGCHTPFF